MLIPRTKALFKMKQFVALSEVFNKWFPAQLKLVIQSLNLYENLAISNIFPKRYIVMFR